MIDDPMKEFFEEHDMGITKKDLQKINTKNVLSDRTPNQSKRSDKTFSPKVTKRSGNAFSNEGSAPLNRAKDNDEVQNKIADKKKTRKQSKSKSVARALVSNHDKALSIKEDVMIEDFDQDIEAEVLPKSKSMKYA